MGGRAARWLRRHALDLAGVLAAVVYALPSLWYPFAGDQPIHWYIGQGLLEGHLPYTTGVSTKPPGPFVVHAASILLFGDGQHAVRLADLGFVLGCAALVATFHARTRRTTGIEHTRFWRRGELGLAAVLVSGIHYTYFDWSDTGHPELWQAFFMMASLWVIARLPDGRPSVGAALISGALAGTAVMFKHTAVVTGFAAGVAFVVLGYRDRGVRRSLAMAGLYSAGVFLAMGAFLVPFALTGTLDVVWEVLVERILKYAETSPEPDSFVPPWMSWRVGGVAVSLGAIGLVSGLAVAGRLNDRRERVLGWWIATGTLLTFASVLIQVRALVSDTFAYYFVVVGPFLALCLCWGLRQRFARSVQKRLLFAVLVVALGFAWGPEWSHSDDWSYRKEWASWLEWMRGASTREEHIAHYGPPDRLGSYARQERVGRWIRRRARPGDTLCVQGFTVAIYEVAGLRCPSRHFADVSAYQGLPGWMEEHKRVLRESPPTFFVTFSDRRRQIRRLTAHGYVRHDVEPRGRRRRPTFVVLERRLRSEDAR
jgi:hypothetical protein